jgi:hypothetical protein
VLVLVVPVQAERAPAARGLLALELGVDPVARAGLVLAPLEAALVRRAAPLVPERAERRAARQPGQQVPRVQVPQEARRAEQRARVRPAAEAAPAEAARLEAPRAAARRVPPRPAQAPPAQARETPRLVAARGPRAATAMPATTEAAARWRPSWPAPSTAASRPGCPPRSPPARRS